MSAATIAETMALVRTMSDSDQLKVLALLDNLGAAKRPRGLTGKEFIEPLPPPISEEAAREMMETIEEGCEWVPPLKGST